MFLHSLFFLFLLVTLHRISLIPKNSKGQTSFFAPSIFWRVNYEMCLFSSEFFSLFLYFLPPLFFDLKGKKEAWKLKLVTLCHCAMQQTTLVEHCGVVQKHTFLTRYWWPLGDANRPSLLLSLVCSTQKFVRLYWTCSVPNVRVPTLLPSSSFLSLSL